MLPADVHRHGMGAALAVAWLVVVLLVVALIALALYVRRSHRERDAELASWERQVKAGHRGFMPRHRVAPSSLAGRARIYTTAAGRRFAAAVRHDGGPRA